MLLWNIINPPPDAYCSLPRSRLWSSSSLMDKRGHQSVEYERLCKHPNGFSEGFQKVKTFPSQVKSQLVTVQLIATLLSNSEDPFMGFGYYWLLWSFKKLLQFIPESPTNILHKSLPSSSYLSNSQKVLLSLSSPPATAPPLAPSPSLYISSFQEALLSLKQPQLRRLV